MAYRGSGVPQFGYNEASTDMPAPVKGGRNETFEVIQDIFENINNELLPGDKLLRFVGEYEFSEVPNATLELLIGIYNTRRVMKWAPHKDLALVAYVVIIEEFNIIPINGLIDYDGLKIKVKAVNPVTFIPSSNNLFALSNYPRVCSFWLVDAVDTVNLVEYAIETLGNTNFAAIGAVKVDATACVNLTKYTIQEVGTTNWTLIGAPDSNLGTTFIASGPGAGDGVAYETIFTATGAGTGTGTLIRTE